jgi:hypothetical protein
MHLQSDTLYGFTHNDFKCYNKINTVAKLKACQGAGFIVAQQSTLYFTIVWAVMQDSSTRMDVLMPNLNTIIGC